MKRLLFTFGAVVSLVLCLAAATLWLRSHWRVDLIGMDGRETVDHWQRGGHAASAGGILNIEWWLRQNGPNASHATPTVWAYGSWPVSSYSPERSWHGFNYEVVSGDWTAIGNDHGGQPIHMMYLHRVSVPHWFVVAPAGLLVALWLRGELRRRRRKRRRHENRCANCGYDLRASPERCPECGAIAGAAVQCRR